MQYNPTAVTDKIAEECVVAAVAKVFDALQLTAWVSGSDKYDDNGEELEDWDFAARLLINGMYAYGLGHEGVNALVVALVQARCTNG